MPNAAVSKGYFHLDKFPQNRRAHGKHNHFIHNDLIGLSIIFI